MTIWYGELTADCELPDYDESELEDIDLEEDCGNVGMSDELLPGLSEDVAFECLLRMSITAFPQLKAVCRRWGQLVTSKDFYKERKKAGRTRNCVCIVQSLPEVQDQAGVKNGRLPEFGITLYDWQKQDWSRLPCIPEFPTGLPLFCRLVGVDGQLFVLGGWHPESYEALRTVYVYDYTSQMWKRCADMPSCRSFYACGAIDDRIYVAGGHDDNKNALDTAEVYVVAEDRWEVMPRMSEARDECGGVIFDGKFIVISGYGTAQGQFSSSADSYDPLTGEWSRMDGMWTEGLSPGPFAESQGQLYAVQRQNLLRYAKESSSWTVVDKIPGEGRLATWISSTNDGALVIMTLQSTTDRNKALIHRRVTGLTGGKDRSEWLPVETTEMFSGLGRAACTIDV